MKYTDNNNVGAKYYDDIYGNFIDDELTKREVKLITGLIPTNGKIMDLGCGTGRHLIELTKVGIDITGVDIAKNMVKMVKKKHKPTKVIKADIYTDQFDERYDLITIFWNAIMEISRDEVQLKLLFEKLKSILNSLGKVLVVNLYDESKPANDGLNFSEIIEKDNRRYRLTWLVKKFDKKLNTTVCTEIIEVLDRNMAVTKRIESDILQKWWRKDQLAIISNNVGYSFEELTVSNSKYNYYLFSLSGDKNGNR